MSINPVNNKAAILIFLIFSMAIPAGCSREDPGKQVYPWYIYHYNEGSSFNDITPVKDMIGSISIFGNPPKSFIDECHQNNIEVYSAVGGNETNIHTPEKIEALADEYLNTCITDGYDGIDLDFEHLSPDFQSTYTGFLKVVSKKLHSAGKKLSHCVGFYPALYQNAQAKIFYDPVVLASTCDLVRVMCYDMYYAPGISDSSLANRDDCMGMGPTSNYPWAKEAMLFWIKHIPKDKLVMALPAYSNDYVVSGNIKGQQIYKSVPDSVSGVLPSPRWLWYEKINMYLYNDVNGKQRLFYASDARSTEALLELADALHIRKIGFWHFGSVDPEMWNVVQQWQRK